MKVAYPLASLNKSKANDVELRASLRALYHNHILRHNLEAEIIIVSDYLPPWMDSQKVTLLDFKEAAGYKKAVRVAKKMKLVCDQTDEPFLFMNDDFYINEIPHPVPNYHNGDLWEFSQKVHRRYGVFKQMLIDTYHWLKKNNMPTRQFAQHLPVMIDPARMLEVFPFEEVLKRKYLNKVYSLRLIYGNATPEYTWEEMKGHKINHSPKYLPVSKTDRAWYLKTQFKAFSIGDKFVFGREARNFLLEVYPEPSPWEK